MTNIKHLMVKANRENAKTLEVEAIGRAFNFATRNRLAVVEVEESRDLDKDEKNAVEDMAETHGYLAKISGNGWAATRNDLTDTVFEIGDTIREKQLETLKVGPSHDVTLVVSEVELLEDDQDDEPEEVGRVETSEPQPVEVAPKDDSVITDVIVNDDEEPVD